MSTDWFAIQSAPFRAPSEVLEEAIREFKPRRVFACFSGGNDSQMSTHFAMTNGYADEVFNINTGIGIPEARDHIYSYSTASKEEYLDQHMLIRNPVTEKLGISGECLCGAFRAPGERKKLKRYYPDFDSYLCVLEDRARGAKQPYHEWGVKRFDDPNQEDLDFMPMCVNCVHSQREAAANGDSKS